MGLSFKKKNFFFISLLRLGLAYGNEDDYTEIEFIPLARRNITEKENSHPFIPGPQRRVSNRATSTNWAGYVATAKNNATAVSGTWKVPVVQKPNGKIDTYSAFWIGIDGYTSSSVEQIGTAHNYINGKPNYYAWFEMYPQPSYSFTFPLAPGDSISASIVYQGNGVFAMSLRNNTKKIVVTIPTSYTTYDKALRSCVVWIVEAPYLNGILPLANFGIGAFMRYLNPLINLYDCQATVDGVTAQLQNNSWKAFPVDMVNSRGGVKAITSNIINGSGFTVTWKNQ